MAKTKFFRVATSGATTDGRVIDPKMLLDMAETYDPDTFRAGVNVEHINGASPDGPFGNYGHVTGLKTAPVTLNIGGKPEQRTALYAAVDALKPLRDLNQRGQKLFPSVRIAPNFANSGKAYLHSLAVTDDPASLGTQALAFSARNPATISIDGDEFTLEMEEDGANNGLEFSAAPGQPAAFSASGQPAAFSAPGQPAPKPTLMEAVAHCLGRLGFSGTVTAAAAAAPAAADSAAAAFSAPASVPGQPAPAPVPGQPAPGVNLAADPALRDLFTTFASSLQSNADALASLQAAATRADAEFAALTAARTNADAEFAALKAQLEKLPASSFTPRKPATGDGPTIRTDC